MDLPAIAPLVLPLPGMPEPSGFPAVAGHGEGQDAFSALVTAAMGKADSTGEPGGRYPSVESIKDPASAEPAATRKAVGLLHQRPADHGGSSNVGKSPAFGLTSGTIRRAHTLPLKPLTLRAEELAPVDQLPVIVQARSTSTEPAPSPPDPAAEPLPVEIAVLDEQLAPPAVVAPSPRTLPAPAPAVAAAAEPQKEASVPAPHAASAKLVIEAAARPALPQRRSAKPREITPSPGTPQATEQDSSSPPPQVPLPTASGPAFAMAEAAVPHLRVTEAVVSLSPRQPDAVPPTPDLAVREAALTDTVTPAAHRPTAAEAVQSPLRQEPPAGRDGANPEIPMPLSFKLTEAGPPASAPPIVASPAAPVAAAPPTIAPPVPQKVPDPSSPTVPVREGRFGTDIGVTIARAVGSGRVGLQGREENARADDLIIRLEPRHLGRIEVRLGFDPGGVLRAVVAADSPVALDMLRRESSDLDRALGDAGVRADAQSLRFDAGGSSEQEQRHARPHVPGGQGARFSHAQGQEPGEAAAELTYMTLPDSGRVDLMA
jgi:flagellar hook-length control protein FliK